MPACSAGLYESAARYAPYHELGGTLRSFVARILALLLLTSVLVCVVLALTAGPVGSLLFAAGKVATGGASAAHTIPLTRTVLVCVVTLACYQTLLGMFKGLRMFRAIGAAELTASVIFTLGAITIAWAGHDSAQAVMWSYALSCVVSLVLFAPALAARLRLPPADTPVHRAREPLGMLRFGVWAAATAVTWHILSYYPMWYLLKVSDGQTVGAFHAVRIVTQLVQVGAAMLTAAVAADINRRWERDGEGAIGGRLALLTKVCLLTLFLAATGLSLAKPLVMRLFPDRFALGASAYDPLVLFFLLVGLVGLIAIRLNLLERPRSVFLAWLVGAVVNVGASFLLIGSASHMGGLDPAGALSGAAWAGTAGVAASAIVCIVMLSHTAIRVDIRSFLLAALCGSVGWGWVAALPISAALILLAVMSPAVFTRPDRDHLRACLAAATQ